LSRYAVNKLLLDVDLTDESLRSFKTNPEAYVAAWEEATLHPVPPVPRGGSLTGVERSAVVNLDVGALYAMGANPYALWLFARSVSVPDLGTIEQLIESFRTAVEPHGYPDFST
jgi:hypothetical protein